MNDSFWELLTKLEQILIPYCRILNILQGDKARLYEVLHGFAYLYQFWQKYPDNNIANEVLNRLQKRWEQWEQPLLILSWLLHPAYKANYFTESSKSKISYLHLGKWLVYYYKAWTGNDPTTILTEFDDFSQGTEYPLMMNLLPTLEMIFINIGVGFEVHIQKLVLLERVYLEFVLMLPQ